MASIKAVPAGVLRREDGRVVKMEAGPCLYCGQHVEEGRDMAGATNPLDPCWQVDGDFGCDRSPWTGEDGTGDHMRPFDLIRLDLGYGVDGKRREHA